MSFALTLWLMGVAAAVLALSLAGVRRRPTGFSVGWVPWHGLLLLSLILLVLLAAHLPAVWPR